MYSLYIYNDFIFIVFILLSQSILIVSDDLPGDTEHISIFEDVPVLLQSIIMSLSIHD